MAKTALEGRARDHGVRTLRTNNLAENEAVKALNRALGYRRTVGRLRMRRDPEAG